MMRNFLKKIFGKSTLARVSTVSYQDVGKAMWTTYNIDAYLNEGYAKNPYLYAAIDLIQTAIAGIDPLVQIDDHDQLFDLPADHPANALLACPCEMLPSLPEWASVMCAYEILTGSAFAVALTRQGLGVSNGELPTALIPVSPKYIAPKPLLNAERKPVLGYIGGYEYKSGRDVYALNPQDVFWFRKHSLVNDFEGMSTVRPLERTIDTNNAAINFSKAVLDNGGFVGTVFVADNPAFGKEQAENLKSFFDANYSGASKAGKTYWAWGGVKPYRIGATPLQLGYDNIMQLTAREVAIVTKVPAQLLGDTNTQTYSNYQEAREGLYTEAVIPILTRFYNALSVYLSKIFGDKIKIKIDLDNIPALSRLRAEARKSLREDYLANLITRTEARRELGFSAVDDGGEYYAENDVITIDDGEKIWKGLLKRKNRK